MVGRKVSELKLPQGAMVGAIVRRQAVIIAHKSTVIEAEDRMILFVNDKKLSAEVEKLFQLGTFFL